MIALRALALFTLLALAACSDRPTLSPAQPAEETEPTTGDPEAQREAASRRPPAGASCAGSSDCSSGQQCVEHRCRYPRSSVRGEIMASAATLQSQAGDYDGALRSYEAVFEAFAEANAPIPPEIACHAAAMMLTSATDEETRERAAQRADLCFRSSVAGFPGRVAVREALARLRFEGLDLSHFDAAEPQDRFFTEEPSRPTVDAVQVSITLPELERPLASYTQVGELLRSEDGTSAVAECFISDWDLRHNRSASAELIFRYTTVLRELPDYDIWIPTIEVQQSTTAQDGFEPCLAAAIPALLEGIERAPRRETWSQPIRFEARVQ
jgi:hypothetical protein